MWKFVGIQHFYLVFKIYCIFYIMIIDLHICMYTICVPTVSKSKKRQDLLELEFLTIVSCHVSAENRTPVRWKSVLSLQFL